MGDPWVMVEPHPVFGDWKFLGGKICHRKGVRTRFFEEILSITVRVPVFPFNGTGCITGKSEF